MVIIYIQKIIYLLLLLIIHASFLVSFPYSSYKFFQIYYIPRKYHIKSQQHLDLSTPIIVPHCPQYYYSSLHPLKQHGNQHKIGKVAIKITHHPHALFPISNLFLKLPPYPHIGHLLFLSS
jgi:hypothetical protein